MIKSECVVSDKTVIIIMSSLGMYLGHGDTEVGILLVLFKASDCLDSEILYKEDFSVYSGYQLFTEWKKTSKDYRGNRNKT